MTNARLAIEGKKYTITSDVFIVPDMHEAIVKLKRYAENHEGKIRFREELPYESHAVIGFYNALRINAEFFTQGVIIGLNCSSQEEERFYANPRKRNRSREMTISELKEVDRYQEDMKYGRVEQRPTSNDSGKIYLTLEGVVKGSLQERIKFYKITGLSKFFPFSLRLKVLEDEEKWQMQQNK
jgi:hypothetical protein